MKQKLNNIYLYSSEKHASHQANKKLDLANKHCIMYPSNSNLNNSKLSSSIHQETQNKHYTKYQIPPGEGHATPNNERLYFTKHGSTIYIKRRKRLN